MTPLKQIWLLSQRCRPPITQYPDCRGLIINAGAEAEKDEKNALVDAGKFVATIDDRGHPVMLGR